METPNEPSSCPWDQLRALIRILAARGYPARPTDSQVIVSIPPDDIDTRAWIGELMHGTFAGPVVAFPRKDWEDALGTGGTPDPVDCPRPQPPAAPNRAEAPAPRRSRARARPSALPGLEDYQREDTGLFAHLTPDLRPAARRWLERLETNWRRRHQNRRPEPWCFAILCGQAARLARNPPSSAWGRSMHAKRGGLAVQQRYRLEGRDPTGKADRVRQIRRGKQDSAPVNPDREIYLTGTCSSHNGTSVGTQLMGTIADRLRGAINPWFKDPDPAAWTWELLLRRVPVPNPVQPRRLPLPRPSPGGGAGGPQLPENTRPAVDPAARAETAPVQSDRVWRALERLRNSRG